MKESIKKYFYFLLCICLFTNCKSKDDYFNSKLDRAYSLMNRMEAEEFKNETESNALAKAHLTYGLEYRNKYLRGKEKDSNLISFFKSKDIVTEDDMSEIIFTSLHRRLNSKKINLESQIRDVLQSYKYIEECSFIRKRRWNILRESLMDTVVLVYPVNEKNAFGFICPPENWIQKFKTLKVTGVPLNINPQMSNSEIEFIIIDINPQNVDILGKEYRPTESIVITKQNVPYIQINN